MLFPLLLIGLLVSQDDGLRGTVRRAVELTAEMGYAYEVDGRFGRTGEYAPGPLLVSRIRSYGSVRYRDAMLYKGAEGLWKTEEELRGEKVEKPDPNLEAIVKTLKEAEPPHEMLRKLLLDTEGGRKIDPVEIAGIPCDGYLFPFRRDNARSYLEERIDKAVKEGRMKPPEEIRWTTTLRGTLRVYLSRKENALVRAIDERSVKFVGEPPNRDGEKIKTYSTLLELDFRNLGTAVPQIPPEVRKRLKIPE